MRHALPLVAAAFALAVTGCTLTSDSSRPDSASSQGPELPLTGKTVAVDPGHNGGNADHPDQINHDVDAVTLEKPCDTTGAHTEDGYPEHEFNFDVAQRLAEILRADGAEVVLTRADDDGVGPCFSERAEIGNDADSDVAVTIHADGAPEDLRGFHIITPEQIPEMDEAVVEESAVLAEDVRDAFLDGADIPPSDYIGEDGVNVRDEMGGLNLSTVPKVMAECGNMRNADDAEVLTDPDGRQQIAEALADGLTRYLT